MTLTKRTITEAGSVQDRSRLARRESMDILDRLTIPPRPDQLPVLTEEQAAAGRILRMHFAEAQVSIQTTFNGMDDRVDISRSAPMWGPSGGAGSELSRRWLVRMDSTLGPIDGHIVKSVSIRHQEPGQLFEFLKERGFVYVRREVTTHTRRAFENLRRFCDGA